VRNANGCAIDFFHFPFQTDSCELVFARVKGEGLDHFRARMNKFAMQFFERFGIHQTHFRCKRSSLNVSTLFKFQ
jgi:hypothetical protein